MLSDCSYRKMPLPKNIQVIDFIVKMAPAVEI